MFKFSNLLNFDLFPNEKLVSNQPFVEKKVPENPVWVGESKNEKLAWWLRPIKFQVKD